MKHRGRGEPTSDRAERQPHEDALRMNGAFVMAQSVHTKSRHFGVFLHSEVRRDICKISSSKQSNSNMKGLPGQTKTLVFFK